MEIRERSFVSFKIGSSKNGIIENNVQLF